MFKWKGDDVEMILRSRLVTWIRFEEKGLADGFASFIVVVSFSL